MRARTGEEVGLKLRNGGGGLEVKDCTRNTRYARLHTHMHARTKARHTAPCAAASRPAPTSSMHARTYARRCAARRGAG